MIIIEKVFINIVPPNIKHYLEKGYDCKYGDKIEVSVEDLK